MSYPPFSHIYIYISIKECKTFLSQSVVVTSFLSTLHIIFIWKALPVKGYDLDQLCISLSPFYPSLSLSLYLPIRPSEYLYLCSNQTDARLTTTTNSTTFINSTKTKISVFSWTYRWINRIRSILCKSHICHCLLGGC